MSITARTQISVFCQYLKIVENSKIISNFIRADRKIEISMIANAHFKLSQAVRTKVDDFDIEFENSFKYETSTKNVRIEA